MIGFSPNIDDTSQSRMRVLVKYGLQVRSSRGCSTYVYLHAGKYNACGCIHIVFYHLLRTEMSCFL